MVDAEMQEILDNRRGHRVITTNDEGEVMILRRTKNGIQLLFPDRPRRSELNLSASRQQSVLGAVST